ncbi:MAG: hypothetical protein QME51_05790 [Planctomycetota bacterium]|nr:hypothetical protein [Planctomycetota bacterium]
MPAVSENQRRLFAIAKSIKEGKTPMAYSPEATNIAQGMTAKELHKYAKSHPGMRRKSAMMAISNIRKQKRKKKKKSA